MLFTPCTFNSAKESAEKEKMLDDFIKKLLWINKLEPGMIYLVMVLFLRTNMRRHYM